MNDKDKALIANKNYLLILLIIKIAIVKLAILFIFKKEASCKPHRLNNKQKTCTVSLTSFSDLSQLCSK